MGNNLLGTAQVDNVSTGQTCIVWEESILRVAGHVNDILILHGFLVLVSSLSQLKDAVFISFIMETSQANMGANRRRTMTEVST